MRYRILNGQELVNTIEAEEPFVVGYCARNGYTFEMEPDPEPEPEQPVPEDPTPEPDPSVWDELDAAYKEGVNRV